jgi:hypothetical protein
MTFSPRLIEAKLALNMVHPEDFPMLAINALEADLDGPTIRKVSGLIQPSGYTTDLLRERFMAEAGLVNISKDTACARLAQELARDAIRSGADPLQFTKDLKQLWIAADYPSTLQDIGGLDEEVYISEYMGHTLSETREMVRKHLWQFAELPDVP